MRNIIVVVIIIAITAMLPIVANIANASPPMGPVAEKVEQAEVGPTKAALDKAVWLDNMPKHRDFGPYGMKSEDPQPKVTGLQTEWSNSPVKKTSIKDAMSKKEAFEQKHRPTGLRGVERKASMMLSSVVEAGKAYGKTLKGTGKALYRNLQGE